MEKPAKDESDASTAVGEVSKYNDHVTDSEIGVGNNPVHEEDRDTN
ncbi:hypothetical protein AVEN_141544-1, partial [Araneus ventricosus]